MGAFNLLITECSHYLLQVLTIVQQRNDNSNKRSIFRIVKFASGFKFRSLEIWDIYTDTINDIGCKQMVDFPTRIDNTLDIFCTNCPSLVDRCIPLPGLSDHDTVLVDCKVLPARKKPIRRKIYLWRRANKPAMD